MVKHYLLHFVFAVLLFSLLNGLMNVAILVFTKKLFFELLLLRATTGPNDPTAALTLNGITINITALVTLVHSLSECKQIATMKGDKKKAKEVKSLAMLEKEYRKIGKTSGSDCFYLFKVFLISTFFFRWMAAVFPKSIELRRQALVYICVFCIVVAFVDLRGPPVANLPFTAMFPIKKMTHLGLDGDDYTQLRYTVNSSDV